MATSPYVCCSDDCRILEDDFERSEIGCRWEERSGTWSLVDFNGGKRLRESGTSDALIVAQPTVPDMSFRVAVDTPFVRAGAIYRLIVNYVDDDNFHFAEFHFPTDTLKIRLRKRVAGSNITLLEKEWDVNMVGGLQAFGVCFSEKVFSASQKFEPYQVWMLNPTPLADGYRAGLGNGSTVQLEYDNFVLEENYDTNEDCTRCVCRCDDKPLPMELTANVSFINSLGACQPVTLTLKAIDQFANCPKANPEFEKGVWYGCADPDCSDCVEPLEFKLYLIFECACVSPNKRYRARLFAEGPSLLADKEACETWADCEQQQIRFDLYSWVEGGACSAQSGDGTDAVVLISW